MNTGILCAYSMSKLSDGTIYIVGGYYSRNYVVESCPLSIDPNLNVSFSKPMLVPRFDHLSVTLFDRFIIVVGG